MKTLTLAAALIATGFMIPQAHAQVADWPVRTLYAHCWHETDPNLGGPKTAMLGFTTTSTYDYSSEVSVRGCKNIIDRYCKNRWTPFAEPGSYLIVVVGTPWEWRTSHIPAGIFLNGTVTFTCNR
jgi:hypothetical protein